MGARVLVAEDDRAIRKPPWWLAGACVALFAGVVALWLLTRGGVPYLDSWLHGVAVRHRGAGSVAVARTVTEGGSTRVVWPLAALAALVFPLPSDRRRWLVAGVFAAGVGAGVGVRLVLSLLVARARPPILEWAATAGGYAFPSGHTTAATLGAGAVAWAVTRRVRRRGLQVSAWVAAALYAGAVGWSRVWLGVHWPLDVVGGWLLGAGWLAAMALVVDRWATAGRVASAAERS